MQVWINYCTHFLFFFLAKYKETEDDSQILYHSNINRYYRQWNEENTNMGKSSCSWWHHHLSLGFSFWSNLYMLRHIFTVDITSYPTFFFFFSPPVVLRDMSRGRDLEQILSQYTTFVKPAFEEFCLPVSVVVSPDYALICSASYSVKQTHITFVSKDILFFPD